jgi:hypothetical protein
MSDQSLDIALNLWRKGLSVIPIPRPDDQHDGKTPAIPWRLYQVERATEGQVRQWFATDSNIAIVTGAVSGVVVVDVDSLEALAWVRRHLPCPPWRTRTARGLHLCYQHPGVRVGNRARIETGDGRLELDVRGDGGYVIAPGSVHATGTVYEFASDWSVDRDRLPMFRPEWLRRAPRPQPTPTLRGPRPAGASVDRARRYLAKIPRPEIGAGSDAMTLYAACRVARGFALSESDAVSLLWEWAGGRHGWTREWIADKVKNALRYGSEPIGALR